MDKDIQQLMKKLGEVLNESLQDSEKVRKIISEVEEKGYSVTLSMAVIVALNEGKEPRKRMRQGSGEGRESEAKATPFDRRFLKALRIKLSEELT